MTISCNGRPVLQARIGFPLRGAWFARIEVDSDSDEPISGAVTLIDEDEDETRTATLEGFARNSAIIGGRNSMMVTAGKGGLSEPVPGRSYYQTTMRQVVDAICRDAGETVFHAPTDLVPFWTTIKSRATEALGLLSDSLGADANWRTRDDGSIWMGTESWPPFSGEATEIDQDPSQRMLILAPDDMKLRPGVTLGGKKITNVVFVVDEHLRAEAWYQ